MYNFEDIINNPKVLRHYEKAKKYFDSKSMKSESDAFDYLIQIKFQNVKHSSSHSEQ